ncbi:MAG: N-acetylneuraminate synthase [Alphaproteobacteria bacterium]|nr:N-acetylneuraminate synthase [Alphaproteobacteria bacterium]
MWHLPEHVFVIAEAGVNHNGSLEAALALVDAAATAGADAVKFQTFRADALVTGNAPKAAYQVARTGESETQHEMLRRLELDRSAHHALMRRCHECGVIFLSTPFDAASLDFLAADLKLPVLKIGSGDLTNAPILLQAARHDLPVILSTGMSSIEDIEEALDVLAFGYGESKDANPGNTGFSHARRHHAALLKSRVTLLHCTTEYPAPMSHTNLRAIGQLAEHFGLPTGFSDHTAGINAAIAAVACGARVVEKHFTLDRNLPGPDHKASLEPEELTRMIQGIREIELALGDGEKRPQPSELDNRSIARRSIVAAKHIAAGTRFEIDHFDVKRPGTGLAPIRLWDLVGRASNRDYAKDEQIDPCLLT